MTYCLAFFAWKKETLYTLSLIYTKGDRFFALLPFFSLAYIAQADAKGFLFCVASYNKIIR